MAHQYSPKMFLRQAPNALLEAYFARDGRLSDLPWGTLEEMDVDPIYDAWQALPREARDQAELDFQAIDDMASAAGVMAIVEEGSFHSEDLRAGLEAREGFHHKAFWTFLERSRIFEVASLLDQADNMNRRYLLRRKDMLQTAAPARCNGSRRRCAASRSSSSVSGGARVAPRNAVRRRQAAPAAP